MRLTGDGSTPTGARENCIVSGLGRNAEYLPFQQRLSVKLARGGRERYYVDGRSIAVDDDSFLIMNDNRMYASRFEIERRHRVVLDSSSGREWPRRSSARSRRRSRRALVEGAGDSARPVEFAEVLQPHDAIVSPGAALPALRGEVGRGRRRLVRGAVPVPARAHARPPSQGDRADAEAAGTQDGDTAGDLPPACALAVDLVTRATTRASASPRCRPPPAFRNSISCGSSRSCTASRRTPTCSKRALAAHRLLSIRSRSA